MYKKRYNRNIPSINEEDMKILKTKTVAILGLGGLGGYVAEHIARIGVKKIIAVDKDIFDETNLNRQILSNEKNIGRKKSDIFSERIKLVNSEIDVEVFCNEFNKKNANYVLESADICIDGFDNMEGRLTAIEVCRKKNIAFVYGGVSGFFGLVTVIDNATTNNLINFLKTDLSNKEEKNLGNLSFTVGVVASIQTAECIKVILKKGEILNNKILIIDLLKNKYNTFNFTV